MSNPPAIETESKTRGRLVIAIVVVCLLVFLVLTYAIHFTALPDFDKRVATLMRDHANAHRVVRGLFVVITELGSVTVLSVVAAAGILWSCARGRFVFAGLWLMVALGGSLVNVGIKAWIDRERPPHELRDKAIEETNESFPSGHAMGSAIGFGMLGFALYGLLRTRTRRIVIETGLVVLVLLIGFSRVYLRAHWLSDVVAGFALGAAWLVGWLWVTSRWSVHGDAHPRVTQT